MDLNIDMSKLYISSKKRRLSGILKHVPSAYEESVAQEEAVDSMNSSQSEDIPESSSNELSEQSPSHIIEDMGKTAHSVEPRRSSRRKSVINIDTHLPPLPNSNSVQDIDVERDLKDLKKIYLNKRVKKGTPNLETIFEVPTDDEKIMSNRKFKRLISFQELQRNKVKKRPLKAKQSIANYNKLKRKNRVSMDTLMQKLSHLEGD